MADETMSASSDRPWRLLPNRVSRFYRGGLLLDSFRGAATPMDTDRPEDWIGSATRAWTPPDTPPTDEGLSDAEIGGARRRIIDVVVEDPTGVAGDVANSADGPPTTGILVKLLDAGNRLPVHAHPTRDFARRHLGSAYGKAEAWIVLGTRAIPGEPAPSVRLGFARDVERDELRRWIDDERSKELLGAMTERPTAAGDVWFVPPGTPHAIGAGVFILEVQEPTDFSIVLETGGFPIDRADASLRLGWDVALDAIDRRALDETAVAGLRTTIDRGLPAGAGAFFWARRLVAERRTTLDLPARFLVAIVTAGSGAIRTAGGELGIHRGDTVGIPAAGARTAEIIADDAVEVIVCGSSGPPAAGAP
jgi:mannose-6-phosphate isomerase